MGRRKIDDAESAIQREGHILLVEWGHWARVRAPNDWHTSDTIYRASFGRGGVAPPTPPTPPHMIATEAATRHFTPRQRELFNHVYRDHTQWHDMLDQLSLRTTAANCALAEMQVGVAMFVRARADDRMAV